MNVERRGCVIQSWFWVNPKGEELIIKSKPVFSAEWWERYESRDSRTVLRGPWGEIPQGYSPTRNFSKWEIYFRCAEFENLTYGERARTNDLFGQSNWWPYIVSAEVSLKCFGFLQKNSPPILSSFSTVSALQSHSCTTLRASLVGRTQKPRSRFSVSALEITITQTRWTSGDCRPNRRLRLLIQYGGEDMVAKYIQKKSTVRMITSRWYHHHI